MDDNTLKEKVIKIIKDYQKGGNFTQDKYTDTPTDANAVVPRKYVTLNGTTAQRPTSSVIGQFYFDNTLGRPIWWDGASFVDADGNVI